MSAALAEEGFAIIIDGRPLRHYPLAAPGFHGGTELYVQKIAHGLAQLGHTVHVIANDLHHEQQRGPTEWWWPEHNHPQIADFVFAVSTLETISDLSAPVLVFLPNGVDPLLFGREALVDAVACFSQCHISLMTKLCADRGTPLPDDRCYLTGLGVDLDEYETPAAERVPGRMLFANDPARGLLATLDIYDCVKAAVPKASLHISYDFDRQFAQHEWSARCMGEILWECRRRIRANPSIVNLGALTHAELLREQHETYVHAYPSDPPNIGSQIHGMTQIELAAAGVPLVLSDIEAFPELFGETSTLLPVIGSLRKKVGDGEMARVDAQDYADVVIELMRDPAKWAAASEKSRELAAGHSWSRVVENFQSMLDLLGAKLAGPATGRAPTPGHAEARS